MPAGTLEHEPLLDCGFHVMSLGDFRRLCVGSLAPSAARSAIMAGLETLIARLEREAISAEIWIDGSFVTKKENPTDVDLVAVVQSEFVDRATEDQVSTLRWISTNLRSTLLCHSFLHVEYDPFDRLGQISLWRRSYWIKQFGFGRNDGLKGIAVIRVQ